MHYHCLDDTLAKLYHDFKRGNDVDQNLLMSFLRFYRPNHKTNYEQLKRIGINDPEILSPLLQSPDKKLPLYELINSTIFKYILSAEDNNYKLPLYELI